MLTPSKKTKFIAAIKSYQKKWLSGNITELDESGTRLMVNHFLTDVLSYLPLEEVKTEYMIKGTYADYVVQYKGVKHFLVEVKSFSLNLSDKHLRQAVNYGANEGIEWALLTNGKHFEFYKILFQKPIEHKLVFKLDLTDHKAVNDIAELMQYICKESIASKGLNLLWSKHTALTPENVSGLLFSDNVVNFLRKTLKEKSKCNFSELEIDAAIRRVITEPIKMENVRVMKAKAKKVKAAPIPNSEPGLAVLQPEGGDNENIELTNEG